MMFYLLTSDKAFFVMVVSGWNNKRFLSSLFLKIILVDPVILKNIGVPCWVPTSSLGKVLLYSSCVMTENILHVKERFLFSFFSLLLTTTKIHSENQIMVYIFFFFFFRFILTK